MLHTLSPVRRSLIASCAVAVLALAAGGVAWSQRASDDLGCLTGLERLGEIVPKREIASVAVTDSGRMYVTTADERLYVRSGSRWRMVTGQWPGRSLTTVGERTLYTGDAAVFRTRNAGRTWMQLSCELIVLNIAVSPKEPDALYVGAALPEDSGQGDSGGLYRSTDGGRSWTRTTRFPRMDPRQPSVNVLAVDPQRPRSVYVGLESGGVQVSTDAGEHWRFDPIHRVRHGLYGPQLTDLSFGAGRTVWASTRFQGVFRGAVGEGRWQRRGFVGDWVSRVVPDGRDPNVAFAVVNHQIVWRTLDGGRHWKRIAALPPTYWGLTRQGPGNTLYAWNSRDILRSTDQGTTWSRLPRLPL
jgi:hypothetical protein